VIDALFVLRGPAGSPQSLVDGVAGDLLRVFVLGGQAAIRNLESESEIDSAALVYPLGGGRQFYCHEMVVHID
jgi:hypothetical protein